MGVFRPLGKRFGYAVDSHAVVVTAVVVLLFCGSPSAITWVVAFVVINAVNHQAISTTWQRTKKLIFYPSGCVYDSESHLYYLQSRYYDPAIGRFLNADALVSTGQGLLGNNMFAYCGNNPVMDYDPTGHVDWGEFLSGVSLLSVGITAYYF